MQPGHAFSSPSGRSFQSGSLQALARPFKVGTQTSAPEKPEEADGRSIKGRYPAAGILCGRIFKTT